MKKLSLFNDLVTDEPTNSVLIPLRSEMPTVTSVRVKGVLTGALNSFFEISENFGSSRVEEDNVLFQLKQTYPNSTLVFAGDYIWMEMFEQYFDRAYPFPSFNVRDLDTLDELTFEKISSELKQGDFDLLIGHVIGIDHAGHTFGSNHPETERKIVDTE